MNILYKERKKIYKCLFFFPTEATWNSIKNSRLMLLIDNFEGESFLICGLID